MQNIEIKRIYDEPSAYEGTRVLVDRLWPRGVAKDEAGLDEWARDLAPSTALRRWFDHDAAKWDGFVQRYGGELRRNQQAVDGLLGRIDKRKRLTLLTATKDLTLSHTSILRTFIQRRQAHAD